jgi:hypothetical protein
MQRTNNDNDAHGSLFKRGKRQAWENCLIPQSIRLSLNRLKAVKVTDFCTNNMIFALITGIFEKESNAETRRASQSQHHIPTNY